MSKILITGFEPFGGEEINPSYEAVKQLHGEKIGGYEIIGRQIPTVFHQSIKTLNEWIKQEDPEIIICVGQAGGRPAISVERVAINVDDARIPDNDGQQPIDAPINPGGPAAYWSTLPIKAVVKTIMKAGVPAEISQTAGTFVCNHIFYGLMNSLANDPNKRGGFIHIPYIPEQAVNHPGAPSISLSDIIKGLRAAIEATIKHETDIVEQGGRIH